MTIVMYDLVGTDDRRFSPHCWRTRMALAHKGIAHEARPTRFTEIASICDGRQKTVPAIEDGARTVSDSWTIAEYLEDAYPDRPSLFGGEAGKRLTAFVQNWTVGVLHPSLVRLIVLDIFNHLTPEDRDYFRTTREIRFGKTLEEVQAGRDERLGGFREPLTGARLTVKARPFIGGDEPMYADSVVFGAFQWARSISPFKLLADDDPLVSWFDRCLDLHGGLGRASPGYY